MKQALHEALNRIHQQKILIIGDVGLDEYVMGQVSRISPEAPVPVVDVNSEDFRLGLTANVAANISSLGGEPFLLGVIGEDKGGEHFKVLLSENGVSSENLITDPRRPTTRKLRVIAHQQQVVRVDYEKKSFLNQEVEEQLLNKAKELIPHMDLIILQDYAKGVVSEKVSQEIIRLSHENKKVVFVDPSRYTPINYYKGADLIKPNRDEAIQLSGLSFDDLRDSDEMIKNVGEKLMQISESTFVIITEGKKGMQFFSKDETFHIPTYARQVFDVTGAGDTVIAALSLAYSSGSDFQTCCRLANFAAGVVVGHVGCVSCDREELKTYIENH